MPGSDWPERPVCGLRELGDPGARGFELGDGDWPFRGFVLRLDGQLHAYANLCPHKGFQLDIPPDHFLVDEGRLIQCGWHGALFLSDTGECIRGPCVGHSLLRLECRSTNDEVLVRAPDSLQEAVRAARSED